MSASLVGAGPELAFDRSSDLWDDGCFDVAARAVRAAYAAAHLSAAEGAELSIVFADDAAVQVLNRDWRGRNMPTNVLTFPAAEPAGIAHAGLLGDIVLAYETVAREAVAEGKRLDDHLAHLVIHGVLHIYGFGHDEAGEAEAMENAERAALAGIGIADPYRPPDEPEV